MLLVENALNQLWVALALYVPKIVMFLLILVIGWIVAKVIGCLLYTSPSPRD